MKNPKLSVVIPMYNEEENLKKGVLKDVVQYLEKQNYEWEVLVIDDASTDSSLKLVEKFAKKYKKVKVYAEPHRGKGGTVIAGFSKAKGDIILFTDMDQSTPLNQVEKFFPEFEKKADLVIGSRTGRKGAPLSRQIISFGFVVLRRIILGLPFNDTQCGFKAFKKEAAKEIFSKMKVFGNKKNIKGSAVTAAFDLEVLFVARKKGLHISEVLVDWNYMDTKRLNPVKDSIQAVKDMLQLRINALMGLYK